MSDPFTCPPMTPVVVSHTPPGNMETYNMIGHWLGKDRAGMNIVQLSNRKELLRFPDLEIRTVDEFLTKESA